jgi:hypothetical protein
MQGFSATLTCLLTAMHPQTPPGMTYVGRKGECLTSKAMPSPLEHDAKQLHMAMLSLNVHASY